MTRFLLDTDALSELEKPMEAGGAGHFFSKEFVIDTAKRENWDAMSDWLHEQSESYISALRIVGTGH